MEESSIGDYITNNIIKIIVIWSPHCTNITNFSTSSYELTTPRTWPYWLKGRRELRLDSCHWSRFRRVGFFGESFVSQFFEGIALPSEIFVSQVIFNFLLILSFLVTLMLGWLRFLMSSITKPALLIFLMTGDRTRTRALYQEVPEWNFCFSFLPSLSFRTWNCFFE